MSVEDVIARIERGTRLKRPDGEVGGYVIEINEWREIRAALRQAEKEAGQHALRTAAGALRRDEHDHIARWLRELADRDE